MSLLPRSRARRNARLAGLSSRLSLRWLWTRLRARVAHVDRRQEILDAYHLHSAEQVLDVMGNMKGAVMKLGQMMSFVTADVPEQYRDLLKQLQSSAPPMDFALARGVIERELGAPLRKLFRDVEPEPLAAASIGQVHRARLHSGEDVVVKVQYPGVDDAIRADLSNLGWLYAMVSMLHPGLDPKPLAEELQVRLGEELDYAREARSQQLFAELYDGHPYIRIPRVFPERSSARVLTQEYVAGRTFDWLKAQPDALRHRAAEVLYRFVFGSIGHFHVFNGDPHPGNYVFHDDGRVTFLDFGCVKYFPPPMMGRWKQLLRAHLDGDRPAFRRMLETFGFIGAGAAASTDALYEYFRYFYEPFQADRVYTFAPEYNALSFGMMFDRTHPEFGPLLREFNMPADFALVNRIQWGLYSILAELRATGNWHRIHREHLYGDPPATPLGEVGTAFRRGWKERRGLAPDAAVWLEPDGVRMERRGTSALIATPTPT